MIFNVTGGGGAALNFKVVAYASEAALPATAAENTIAIITDTAITSYIFSAEEPSPATAGMVWIQVGDSSSVSFAATKKNPVMVYPLSAKQYVDGAWIDKTAIIYQAGEWVNLKDELWLLDNGERFIAITGDWLINGDGWISSVGMTVKSTGSAGTNGAETNNANIDFSKYSTLAIHTTDNSVTEWWGFGVGDESSVVGSTALTPYAEKIDYNKTVGWLYLPLDGVNEIGKVMIRANSGSDGFVRVNKIYLTNQKYEADLATAAQEQYEADLAAASYYYQEGVESV